MPWPVGSTTKFVPAHRRPYLYSSLQRVSPSGESSEPRPSPVRRDTGKASASEFCGNGGSEFEVGVEVSDDGGGLMLEFVNFTSVSYGSCKSSA